MKCTKAIEILEHHGLKPEDATWQDFLDAVALGAEALKWRLARTNLWASSNYPLLHGEDREEPLAHER